MSLLWDYHDVLPLGTLLGEEDLVILLTPAVVPLMPNSGETSDPFEPFGKALARRHPWIRHIPYTKERGITGTHVAFVRRAKIVIFVITGIPVVDGVSQPQLAEIVREACEDKPMITVACCDAEGHNLHEFGFSTLVQSNGFSTAELEAIATLLMSQEPPGPSSPLHSRPTWPVDRCQLTRDLAEVHTLWLATLPAQFHLERSVLGELLKREGYAMHYIVRDDSDDEIIGFCATFSTYVDGTTSRLIGSIAAIIVRHDFRGRGVGSSLHAEALRMLHKIRGVAHFQLGVTFPRLLYGLPTQVTNTRWYEHRGWSFDETEPGRGRKAADWLLRFAESPAPTLASHGLTFRTAQLSDQPSIVAMAMVELEKRLRVGWHDQYTRTMDGIHERDVILGFEGETLVATAITYTNADSPITKDIPWAASIASDMGGVSCICIKGKFKPLRKEAAL